MTYCCQAMVLLIICAGSLLAQAKEFVGDVKDGNRSAPVHLIRLYDEWGYLILPEEKPAVPFSEKVTCGKCHDYAKISRGLHFNAADSGAYAGRIGEPWILVDRMAATQVPVSYRQWPGTFAPRAVGLSTLQFLSAFGHHFPGGSVGEAEANHERDDYMRWQISGNLEVNCENCHNVEPGQNQAEYGLQVLRQNFRWAPAASSGFATVLGAAREMPASFDIFAAVPAERSDVLPPTVIYNRSRFDVAGRVLFDEARRIPPEKCYFCHSLSVIDSTRSDSWAQEQDVHMAAGMVCIDCHRNGLDHNMIRGYDAESGVTGNVAAASFTCKGCHLGSETGKTGKSAIRKAPRPQHPGIPPVHFERLTCTACHAGPWPGERTFSVKTSRAHAMGLPVPDKSGDALPHIVAPVFVKAPDGRFEPRAMFWPSFWGYVRHDGIRPIPPSTISPLIAEIFRNDTTRDVGRWPKLLPGDVRMILDQLSNLDSTQGLPAYVAGGEMFLTGPGGTLEMQPGKAAEEYSWPLGHDVRPKEESLGANGCDDCHSTSSPFFFGTVTVASPFIGIRDSLASMTSYQDQGKLGPWLFSMSFFFRPFLKAFVILSFCLIAIVILVYFTRGIYAILQRLGEGRL